MRQIAFVQFRKYTKLFSWNNVSNDVGVLKPACNSNLDSHIVSTAIKFNVLYNIKCATQTMYCDEKLTKRVETKETKSYNVETLTLFTILLKLIRDKLNNIVTSFSSEPQTIFGYISWKVRELLMSTIISTGIIFPDSDGRGPDSYLRRCANSISGHLFSRHPMHTLDQSLRLYLAKKAIETSYTSSRCVHLFPLNCQYSRCDHKSDKPGSEVKIERGETNLPCIRGVVLSRQRTSTPN